MQEPGIAQYLRDVGNTLGETLASWLSVRLGGLAGTTSHILVYVGYTLLGILVTVCLWLGFRFLLERWARPTRRDDSVRDLRPQAVTPSHQDSWETALRQALAAGDVGQAVHALWWWLAQSLGCGADPSWTSRELVQRAGRRDLRPHVRRLDRLLYSPRAPRLEEVESLWHDLRPLVTPDSVTREAARS